MSRLCEVQLLYVAKSLWTPLPHLVVGHDDVDCSAAGIIGLRCSGFSPAQLEENWENLFLYRADFVHEVKLA